MLEGDHSVGMSRNWLGVEDKCSLTQWHRMVWVRRNKPEDHFSDDYNETAVNREFDEGGPITQDKNIISLSRWEQ